MAQKQSFPLCKRGNTWSHRFTFSLVGGIASCGITMMVKKSRGDADALALATISDTTSGITKVSSLVADFRIEADVTATFPTGDLWAGIQFTLPNGDTIELEAKDLDPRFSVEGDVVRATP